MKINLDSVREMYSSNSAFLSDIWQAEKSLGDAESSMNSILLEKDEILKSIAEICGYDFDVSGDAALPENIICFFDTDPILDSLQTQLLVLDNQLLIDRQNSAAVISVSGQFKDTSRLKDSAGLDFGDDTNYLSWSATVSGKINNLYGGERKLLMKK